MLECSRIITVSRKITQIDVSLDLFQNDVKLFFLQQIPILNELQNTVEYRDKRET